MTTSQNAQGAVELLADAPAAQQVARTCSNIVTGRRAARALADWSRPFALGEPEFQILWRLRCEASGAVDQATLAEQLALSPAAVSATVDRLSGRGLILRTESPGDRRRHLWRLSDEGCALLQRLLYETEALRFEAKSPGTSGRPVLRVVASLLLAVLVVASGCTRAHYRRQADAEVNRLIDNKSVAVGTAPGEFRIDVDPRSRMFDASNPDCPPMPPDDPISHQLMRCVDCKPGSPCWQHVPRTPYTDNPVWEEYLPRDAEGNILLDLNGAVELALLQSPQYQQQLETLYLAGLDVTFERFRFDTQFFGGSSIFFTADGRERTGTGSSSSLLEVHPLRPGNRLRAEKLTATGGELVIGLANSLMWQFSGMDDYSSRTVLDFNFIQPLLRAGGRTRVMERLTISERALIANVRQMEQYRRGFYVNVVTGRDPGEGPNRRGGFFGGAGLEGFSGVGGGGFGRVGGFGGGGFGGGFGFTGGAGAAGAGGYLGLLQNAQVIRNQYANVAGLRDSFEQLQAAYEAGRMDRFQVDLARQALYNAQSQLLNAEAQYQTSLDAFKVQYGLPPNLPVKIEDPLLDRFNLLDPGLVSLQTQVSDVLTVLRDVAEDREEEIERTPAGLLLQPRGAQLTADEYVALLDHSGEFITASEQQYLVAQADLERLMIELPRRRAVLERLAERPEVRDAAMDVELFSAEGLDERVATLQTDLEELGRRMTGAWSRLRDLTGAAVEPSDEHRRELARALTELSGELLELSLLQARARLDTIAFDPVDLSPEEAYCIASRHRRDWMNARAALVDSWRLIHFNANDLQSNLNLVFSGDIANVGDNPFRLRSTNGRLRVGMEFDAPLTRLAERNVYRQSLIEYQQARRSYYGFRDRVYRDLRTTLRQLRVDELNFELRRAAVHVAITQVDLARLRLAEPARPVQPGAPGTPVQPATQAQFGATVARDLVDAQINLLNVQNDFLSVWVDHDVQRLNLEFDLGVMELDENGLRIETDQPLRAFLEYAPWPGPPCELPDPCAVLPPEHLLEEMPGLHQPELTPPDPPVPHGGSPVRRPFLPDGDLSVALPAPTSPPESEAVVPTSARKPTGERLAAAATSSTAPDDNHPIRLPATEDE